MTFNRFLLRARLGLLYFTLLWVVGLNHQAVAMYRLPAPRAAAGSQVKAAPRSAVVKQKVTLEATAPLGPWLAPAADAWLPAPPPAPRWRWAPLLTRSRKPRPGALPDAFRTHLLVVSLSPHAP